jgi:glutamate synthase domain-containing protein 1
MCGIVGLFIKDAELERDLGLMLAGMLEEMSSRGPDSAGFALYGEPAGGGVKATVRTASAAHADALAASLAQHAGALGVGAALARDTHVIVGLPEDRLEALLHHVRGADRAAELVGLGSRMELYKEVGAPADITARFGLRQMRGSHAIGHTRMATESAVTTDGAHPFSTGRDQCLVHNGSLSNHNRLRDKLRREGLVFHTENDTEVAAAYLTWRMREGMGLGEALEQGLQDLDGFYTFVVGTEDGFGVLRDPIACKPAVIAETDRYVAFASEYRALANLPGVDGARLFEPEPATVYFWERH